MKLDLRTFPPIEFGIEPPEKLSQTFLSHFDKCNRAGSFYLRYGGGTATAAMTRGSIFHRFAEQATKQHYETGEIMPPEVARDLITVTITEAEEVVPESEHDDLRLMAWNWAEAFTLPVKPVAVETMFEADVAGCVVRGKIDLAGWGLDGLLGLYDYKTGNHLPDVESVKKDFQGKLYAYLVANGYPFIECEGCDGKGEIEGVIAGSAPEVFVCPDCEGSGGFRGERVSGIQAVRFQQVYPMRRDKQTDEVVMLPDDGHEFDAEALHDFGVSLAGIVERAKSALDTKLWPAQKGSHCRRCPSRKECPIPGHLNEHLPLRTQQEASVAMELALDLEERRAALLKAVKDYSKESDEAVQVGDRIFKFDYKERRTLDKKRLAEVLSTTPDSIDPDDLYKVSRSTPWQEAKAA